MRPINLSRRLINSITLSSLISVSVALIPIVSSASGNNFLPPVIMYLLEQGDSNGFIAASRIEAEDFTSQSGVETEASSEGTDSVGFINDGDYIKFENVDFANGVESFNVRVASGASGGPVGTLLHDQLQDTICNPR